MSKISSSNRPTKYGKNKSKRTTQKMKSKNKRFSKFSYVKIHECTTDKSEKIRNWTISISTVSLAIFTALLFYSTTQQVNIIKKLQAARFHISNKPVQKIPTSDSIKFIIETELHCIGGVPAKHVEINSRADLLEKNFEGKIEYINKPRYCPNITIQIITLKDTIVSAISDTNKISKTLWIYLHIQLSYNNGFDEKVLENPVFRYNTITKEWNQCKHNDTKNN